MSRVKKQKKHRRGVLRKILSFLIICAAMLAGISVFFKIAEFKVEGNVRCTQEDVIEASGVQMGDNLLFINKAVMINGIYKKLPYVSQIKLGKEFPDTLVFKIKESKAVAAVKCSGGYVLLDGRCKVLEKSNTLENTPLIEGITAIAPETGEELELGLENSAKKEYLQRLLGALTDAQLEDRMGNINMENIADVTFMLENRFTVKLGSYEGIEEKLSMLCKVMDSLSPGDMGTIDVSNSKEAHVIPY